MITPKAYPELTAEEAASLISDNSTVGFSGFTSAGAAKSIPRALAKQAEYLHARGESYKLNVLAGASTGKSLDSALAKADAIHKRIGYQSSKILRQKINNEEIEFIDTHLSHLPKWYKAGPLAR